MKVDIESKESGLREKDYETLSSLMEQNDEDINKGDASCQDQEKERKAGNGNAVADARQNKLTRIRIRDRSLKWKWMN